MAINESKSRIDKRPFFDADPAATWEAGMQATLTLDGSGNRIVTVADATVDMAIEGTFKGNKTTQKTRTIKDELVDFTGGDVQNLNNSNLVADQIYVTSLDGLTVYTEGGGNDYTVNDLNGVITRLGGGTIPAGGSVLVTYRYQLTQQQLEELGLLDHPLRVPDDTVGSGKATIIVGWATIYTDMYDLAQAYALGDVVRVSADGLLTTGGSGEIVGKVVDVPTEADPSLGFEQIVQVPSP